LFARSLRHFVFNRQGLQHPWRIPFALGYWLAGLPWAAAKRLSGARLLVERAAQVAEPKSGSANQ
jgi:hypothetical protein